MDDIDDLVKLRDEIRTDIKNITIMIDQFKFDYNVIKSAKDNDIAKIITNLLKQFENDSKPEANFSKNNRQIFTQFVNIVNKYS